MTRPVLVRTAFCDTYIHNCYTMRQRCSWTQYMYIVYNRNKFPAAVSNSWTMYRGVRCHDLSACIAKHMNETYQLYKYEPIWSNCSPSASTYVVFQSDKQSLRSMSILPSITFSFRLETEQVHHVFYTAAAAVRIRLVFLMRWTCY